MFLKMHKGAAMETVCVCSDETEGRHVNLIRKIISGVCF